LLRELVEDVGVRESMKVGLARWHAPGSAAKIAELMLRAVPQRADVPVAGLAMARSHPGTESGARVQSSTVV
jgi:hypothetical protein